MTQVIVHATENNSVVVTIPTGELPIEQVLEKDCPAGAIIIDDSELPQGEDNLYFDAWELVNGKVVVNLDKKNAIKLVQDSAKLAQESAISKLTALGLTEDEIKALKGVA